MRGPRTEPMPARVPDPLVGQVVERVRAGEVFGCVLRGGRAQGRTSALSDIAATLRATRPRAPLALCAQCGPLTADDPYAVLRAVLGAAGATVPGLDGLAPAQAFDAVGALLTGPADGRPVVIIVDDVHRADAESAAVLAELAGGGDRGPGPVRAVVLSAPSGSVLAPALEHLPTVGLAGLGRSGVQAVLDDRAGLATDRVLAELAALCAGNPLVLREFVPDLTDDQLRGRVPLPRLPRLGPESTRVFTEPCRALPVSAQQWLLLMALAGDALGLGLAAARLLGMDLDDLAVAERAGLVRTHGGRETTWPEPMTRVAVLQAATLADSVRLSTALAAASDSATRHVDHVRHAVGARGGQGPVEAEIGGAVATLARDGRLLEAHELALHAAHSAADATDRRRHQVLAAELCWLAGYPEHALDLLSDRGEMWDQPSSSAEVILRWMIQGSGESWLTSGQVPQEAKDDPARAAHLLGSALLAGWESASTEHVTAIVSRMAELPPVTRATRPDAVAALGDVVAGRSAISPQRLAALQTLSWWLQPSDAVHPKAWPPPLVPVFLGAESSYARQFDELLRTPFVRSARSSRSLLLLKLTTAEAAAGRWQEALRHAAEGVAVTEEIGQPGIRAELQGIVEWIRAARGSATPAEVAVSDGDLDGTPSLWTLWIRGLAALSAGRPQEALDQLRELHGSGPRSPHHHVLRRLSTADLVTAAVWAKTPAAAEDVVAEFATWVEDGAADWARLDLARCRAMLGEDAERWHLAALGQTVSVARPFGTARTRLEFGVWLRRARRHREARSHLRAAKEIFAQLEATAWRDRAHAELRAAGEAGRPTAEAPLADLTPQEWRIAEMAAQGMSNRQIADMLVLSARTVGYHLHKVFPKLDITTRAQLARALAALRPPAG